MCIRDSLRTCADQYLVVYSLWQRSLTNFVIQTGARDVFISSQAGLQFQITCRYRKVKIFSHYNYLAQGSVFHRIWVSVQRGDTKFRLTRMWYRLESYTQLLAHRLKGSIKKKHNYMGIHDFSINWIQHLLFYYTNYFMFTSKLVTLQLEMCIRDR